LRPCEVSHRSRVAGDGRRANPDPDRTQRGLPADLLAARARRDRIRGGAGVRSRILAGGSALERTRAVSAAVAADPGGDEPAWSRHRRVRLDVVELTDLNVSTDWATNSPALCS